MKLDTNTRVYHFAQVQAFKRNAVMEFDAYITDLEGLRKEVAKG